MIIFANSAIFAQPGGCGGQPVKGNGILLTQPNGCETYHVGDTMTIAWVLDSTKDGLIFRFSPDNYLNSVIIGNVLSSKPNYRQGPLRWVIPDSVFSSDGIVRLSTVSNECIIRIHEYWFLSIADQSDHVFTILPAKNNRAKPIAAQFTPPQPSISFSGTSLCAMLSQDRAGSLILVNARGQQILSTYGRGTLRCLVGGLAGGLYVAVAEAGGNKRIYRKCTLP